MNQNEALVKSAIHDAVIRAVTEISADVKGPVSYTHLNPHNRVICDFQILKLQNNSPLSVN